MNCQFSFFILFVLLISNTLIAQEDTTKFLFTSYRSGGSEIYIANEDGSGVIQLTDMSGKSHQPVLSPDKSKMLFTRVDEGLPRIISVYDKDRIKKKMKPGIYLYDFNTGKTTALTNHKTAHNFPSWTPDGKRIIFNKKMGNKNRICIMNTDGSDYRVLSPPELSANRAMVSPDGKQIVYQGVTKNDSGEASCDIYIMDTLGQNNTKLTQAETGVFNWKPYWSPSGKYISYLHNGECGFEAYNMKADGSEKTQLFAEEECGECYSYGVNWSPDSDKLAFHTCQGIYTSNPDGSNLRLIYDSGSWPKWLPSGEKLLFVHGKRTDIYSIELNKGKPVKTSLKQLTDIKGEDNLHEQVFMFK